MAISIERDGEARAREALERCIGDGGVAVFPADTLYGLACDPSNRAAVDRIHDLKGREAKKPSAVMFFSPLAMREVISALGPRTREAIGALLPGPVTLVVDNPEHRYPHACREDPGRLGLRLIEGPLAGVSRAVFQTSANTSGARAPSRFDDIEAAILAGADLAVDGGELVGEGSTVVDVVELERGGPWRILREGALSQEEVQRALDELSP